MPAPKLNEQNLKNITHKLYLIIYLLIDTLYFLLSLRAQHFLTTECKKCMLQEKKAEVCRMVLRTQTHTIISNTSFPIQKFAVAVTKIQ